MDWTEQNFYGFDILMFSEHYSEFESIKRSDIHILDDLFNNFWEMHFAVAGNMKS